MPVKADMLKVSMFFQYREKLDGIAWTSPNPIRPPSFGAPTQVLQYRGQHPRRFFERPTDFGQRDKMGRFCRLHQLPPEINLARPAMQTPPVVTTCPEHFACVLVDEAMAQRPRIRAVQQRI